MHTFSHKTLTALKILGMAAIVFALSLLMAPLYNVICQHQALSFNFISILPEALLSTLLAAGGYTFLLLNK